VEIIVKKALIVLTALALSLVSVVAPCKADSSKEAAKKKDALPWVGHYAPDFKLKNPDGKEVSLSDYRGKVVFLNFWAIWCQPCLLELPVLDKLNKDLKSEDFEVIAVNTDHAMAIDQIKQYLKAKNFSFSVLLDPASKVGYQSYFVRGIPVNFIIDRDGVIAKRVQGLYDWSHPSMKAEIIKIIEKPHKKKTKNHKDEKKSP